MIPQKFHFSRKTTLIALLFFCSISALGATGVRLLIDSAQLSAVEALYGEEAKHRVASWGNLMQADRQNSEIKESLKLNHANTFFNQVEWVTDLEHWGEEDYWATPIETLASNGGDCEDFSIGKYFTLLETMVDPQKLRITYVKSKTYNQAHMVLAYYETPGAEPLILDNIDQSIKPASQRQDLVPVYSFSGSGIWLAKERGKKLSANSMNSLPQWKRVNDQLAGKAPLRQAVKK